MRQAFQLAIDRDAINEVAGGGIFEPAQQPFPPASPYHSDKFPVTKRDVAKARALLKQAGFDRVKAEVMFGKMCIRDSLKSGQVDTTGQAIDSEWVPVDMAAVAELIGAPISPVDALGNTHNADKISNPDNLKFSEKLRTLFVGEDSGGHVNNFLWAYNVDTCLLYTSRCV